MISKRDGHVRVLPIHVANKIAAGEVVERPASVVKELVENALDAGARKITISITQGGRRLVAVQDDGCGMSKADAVLSLERQATSKIRDVTDIEQIDTLGFRGEAIPSIASVSRFTLTTRPAGSDEGTLVQVNAGTLAEVRTAGCPPGTLVEVRDLFCNVPARRKFLRAFATEENHVKTIFTTHALAHPNVGFSLTIDGRELYRLAPAPNARERVRELFGEAFLEQMLSIDPCETPLSATSPVRVSGLIEKPNLSMPTRRDQYIFINGRPASAPALSAALREVYPLRSGDTRPAAILFLDLPPEMVDVNVHPTKREVRFRDNRAVKEAIVRAVGRVLAVPRSVPTPAAVQEPPSAQEPAVFVISAPAKPVISKEQPLPPPAPEVIPRPEPVQGEISFAVEPNSDHTQPWAWFKFLAQSDSGYLLIETDAGIVTINPQAARERITYERLLQNAAQSATASTSQTLLIPETVRLNPVDAARISTALETIRRMGFQIEPFGTDTFKIDAVPQLIGSLSPAALITTIARDLSESGSRRSGERWREELIAKSIARSFTGASLTLTKEGAETLVADLCTCRMPYVCPRGKPVMIFTSTRELNRKFDRV